MVKLTINLTVIVENVTTHVYDDQGNIISSSVADVETPIEEVDEIYLAQSEIIINKLT